MHIGRECDGQKLSVDHTSDPRHMNRISKIACGLILYCLLILATNDALLAIAMAEKVISSNISTPAGGERYSNPSFSIVSILLPQGWTEAESNTVKGISVYLKLVRSTGLGGELGALDFTAITLTAIKNSSTTSLSSDPNNNTSFPRELLQHDDPDCELLDKSTSIINQHSFDIFSVRCNTFQYKTYQTIANDTKISLTYSALLAAFPLYLKVFDEAAQTLKISSNSEENLLQ